MVGGTFDYLPEVLVAERHLISLSLDSFPEAVVGMLGEMLVTEGLNILRVALEILKVELVELVFLPSGEFILNAYLGILFRLFVRIEVLDVQHFDRAYFPLSFSVELAVGK